MEETKALLYLIPKLEQRHKIANFCSLTLLLFIWCSQIQQTGFSAIAILLSLIKQQLSQLKLTLLRK